LISWLAVAPTRWLRLYLRAILAVHVTLKLVDRSGLRQADNIQCHGLVGVAAEAADLKIEISWLRNAPPPY
jgi:hypothetical protein